MNITKAALVAIVTLLMTSCYSSHINVGNMTTDHPVRTVATKKNHYLFAGLIPIGNKQVAKDYVGDAKHYRVRTSHKFVDVLISSVTLGIYTPITVTYYLSEFDTQQKYRQERYSFDQNEFGTEDFGTEDDGFGMTPQPIPLPPRTMPERRTVAPPVQREAPAPKAKPAKKKKDKKAPASRVQQAPAPSNQSPSIEELRRQIAKEKQEHERRMRGE